MYCSSQACAGNADSWYWLGNKNAKIALQKTDMDGVTTVFENNDHYSCARITTPSLNYRWDDTSCNNVFNVVCEFDDCKCCNFNILTYLIFIFNFF